MSPRERMALLDGIVAGLALGHVVGGFAGLLFGAFVGNLPITVIGFVCASLGCGVGHCLYRDGSYPFNRESE